MKKRGPTVQKASPLRFLVSLGGLSAVCLVLLFGRIIVTDSSRYIFLLWNLALAIIPAILAWTLVLRVRRHGWLGWQQIGLALLWLSFLPNSFYMITDFVHLRPNYEAELMFDIVLLSSFLLAGLVYGFLSVYLVHNQLLDRFKANKALLLLAFIFLLSSFAVYLGRFSRYNSWDVLLRPAGLLFDVSERFVNPGAHSQTYLTTLIFFLLLFSLYLVVWEATRLIKSR
ncbi:DUF1361 domain-containing protein [Candidatus Parcubacteria bacterium]|nr:DUF1361 domain-containing protein [Candidatus Parcubacteria bacterium]